MTIPLPTGVALPVLLDVARAGALTAAAITRQHGPYPNWSPLITDGLLTSLATVRGAVLVLSPRGHALLQAHGHGPHDRVTGVERAVDRSYQQDALALLQDEGYRVIHAPPPGRSPRARTHRPVHRPGAGGTADPAGRRLAQSPPTLSGPAVSRIAGPPLGVRHLQPGGPWPKSGAGPDRARTPPRRRHAGGPP